MNIKLFDHKMKVVASRPVFEHGPFTLLLVTIEYTRFDGERASFQWLIFDRGNAVAVLVRRKDGKICLVQQFRPATLVEDGEITSGEGGMLEIIAGMRNRVEEQVDCLHREVAEEAGRLIKNVRQVTTAFMSPGACSERVGIYLADDDGPATFPGGGLRSEGEDIRVHWVSSAEAMEMIRSGHIRDAKTILAIQALLLE